MMSTAVDEQVQVQLPFHNPARHRPQVSTYRFYPGNPQNSEKPSRRVGFLEHAPVQRKIVIALEQGFGIPIAALGAVEIAAIEMDRRGQAREWVCYRADHVAPQRLRASFAKGLGAGGLD